MKELFSEKEYEEFLESFDLEDDRSHALRLNMVKTFKRDEDVTKALLQKALGRDDDLTRVPWENSGFYYEEASAPGKHPYHEAGLYYIQEPSAMAPVHFLDPKPGDRVLDLCAAPGGKSTQIADALKGEGLLVTNEINRDRAKILSLNIERMGIANALVLNEDSGHLSEVFEGYFDKILVDAPCSGEGMFRKNANAADEWSPDNVEFCAKRQMEILDNAARMLLPGGRLVYSTCTFSPKENEQNVYRFLTTHPDFHTEKVELVGGMEHGRPEWVKTGKLVSTCAGDVDYDAAGAAVDASILAEVCNSVRLWPHRVDGEGHFLCVFRRDGNANTDGMKNYVPGGRNPKARKEALKPLKEFLEETLNCSGKGCVDVADSSMYVLTGGRRLTGLVTTFGDQLYLCPEDMPGIKGLKVMRPGLHLGTVKKDRFEPSHALALYLGAGDVKLHFDLPSDSDEIQQFLNGQTLRVSSIGSGKGQVSGEGDRIALSGKKGWCLITTDGYSIGWTKLAGGMLKNHYPKGLRINY